MNGVSVAAVRGSVLPVGWEERQDANGRTYFVNHIARTTQWERPSIEAATETSEAGEQLAHDFRQRVHISVDQNDGEDSVSTTASPRQSHLNSRSRDADTPGVSNHRRLSEPASTGDPTSGSTPTQPASDATNVSLNSEGLPQNWSMQVAPNGRVFFIDHVNKVTTWVDPRTSKPSAVPGKGKVVNKPKFTSVDDLGPLPDSWEERVHTDGRIFFIDHSTRTTQWEDPRLSNPLIAGPAVPYSRDYKRKYEYLQTKLVKPTTSVPNKLEIRVSRRNIFEDSFRVINSVSRVDLLKTKLWVEFDGEEVLDYGGASREWFYLLSREMFNPYYGLFEYSVSESGSRGRLCHLISRLLALVTTGCRQLHPPDQPLLWYVQRGSPVVLQVHRTRGWHGGVPWQAARRILHSPLLQGESRSKTSAEEMMRCASADDVGKANRVARHGKRGHRVLQFSQVDHGKRCNGAGPALQH